MLPLQITRAWQRLLMGFNHMLYNYLLHTGVLGGQIIKMRLHFSPGFCDINHGAVEHIDWRDTEMVRVFLCAVCFETHSSVTGKLRCVQLKGL